MIRNAVVLDTSSSPSESSAFPIDHIKWMKFIKAKVVVSLSSTEFTHVLSIFSLKLKTPLFLYSRTLLSNFVFEFEMLSY